MYMGGMCLHASQLWKFLLWLFKRPVAGCHGLLQLWGRVGQWPL